MSSLLPPGSHAERLSKTLEEAMFQELLPENGEFIYVGCCIGMDEHALGEMTDSDEWVDDGNHTDRLHELRENCQGFDIWETQMGYGPDFHLEDDWSVGYGKGTYAGHPCYWVCHSHIEFVWAIPVKFEARQVGTVSGRISCNQPNIANSPKCQHGNAGACYECLSDPNSMKVIPYAVAISELSQWGCPYCGYDKWHIGANKESGMPAAQEGTYVRFCNSCGRFCYALADGVQKSTVPFGGVYENTTAYYPARSTHPRDGQPAHSNKMVQGEGNVSEVPNQSHDGGE